MVRAQASGCLRQSEARTVITNDGAKGVLSDSMRTPEYKCRGMIAVRRNFAILDPFGLILSGGEHQFRWQRVHRHPVGFGGFE